MQKAGGSGRGKEISSLMHHLWRNGVLYDPFYKSQKMVLKNAA
jgi:hypothetical protein